MKTSMDSKRIKELRNLMENRLDENVRDVFNWSYWDDYLEDGIITDEELQYMSKNYEVCVELIKK